MLLRPTLLVLALTASSLAWGEASDPPERVVRLSYVEGQVAFRGAQETARHELPDRPLIPGDRLTTERGGRAELSLGTATIRLDEHTEFSIVDLNATTVRIQLNEGTASIVLHDLSEDESFEIDTPNTAIALQEPGEYRLEVSADGATALTVRSGTAEVGTPAGQVRVADGQRVRFEGRDAFASLTAPPAEDAFDAWVQSREQTLADEESRYAQRDSDEQLDRYGEWNDDPNYGRVWTPSYAYGGYDPFRYGSWQRVGFGWSWIDSVPWGFYTSHSGRWAYLHHRNRWCWVPERDHHPRQVAQDTRPFGHPRDDTRSRDDRRDLPALTRAREDDQRRPVAANSATRRHIEADHQPTMRRAVQADNGSRRETTVRGFGRDQNSPRPSAANSRDSGTTMRPSNASNTSTARSETRTDAAPQTSRTSGARPIP